MPVLNKQKGPVKLVRKTKTDFHVKPTDANLRSLQNMTSVI